MEKLIQINSSEALGGLIKQRRKELGITQSELAKFCNLSHTGIGHIERAQKDIRLETLLKLTGFLGLKLKIELELEQ